MNFLFIRICARLFDYGWLSLLGIVVSMLLPIYVEEPFYLFYNLATFVLWPFVEAACLSRFGATPGKALFGISVTDAKGKRLSFLKGLKWALFMGKNVVVKRSSAPAWRGLCALCLMMVCNGGLFFFEKDIGNVAGEYERHVYSGGKWINYSSTEGGFTVDFPKTPEVASTELALPHSDQPLNLNEYKTTHHDDVAYSVSYLELPKKWRMFSSSTLLKGALRVILGHMGKTELIDKELKQHKGKYPALDFRVDQEGNEVFGRLIIVGGTLYRLTVAYPPQTVIDFAQHQSFLDSFDLKAPQ